MGYGINSVDDLPAQYRADALAQMGEGRKPPAVAAVRASEHDEQVALFEWAALNSARWPCLARLFAIPNGGKRARKTAALLKAEGVRAGVPDVFLPWPVGGCCGLWIEMKAGKNKPTENQRDWLAWLASNGYRVAVCWGADDAIRTIAGYLEGGTE